MTVVRTIRRGVAVLAFAALVSASWANETDVESADREVSVRLHNGRTLSAVIDPESSQQQLWLRWENAAAVIRQPVAWSDVASVEVTAGEYSGQAFRKRLPPVADARVAAKVKTPLSRVREDTAVTSGPAVEVSEQGPRRTIRSLAVDARAANWNADLAVDGIRLTVYPLDENGEVVAISGTVTAELVGDVRSLRKPQPKQRFPHFSRIGWWSRSVQPDAFGTSGAALELPFQSYDLELDGTVRSRTLLVVRLSVPGQGSYQASVADLWARPFSITRNRIEASTGRRYLPQELRGR